jgi:hypothetical protein
LHSIHFKAVDETSSDHEAFKIDPIECPHSGNVNPYIDTGFWYIMWHEEGATDVQSCQRYRLSGKPEWSFLHGFLAGDSFNMLAVDDGIESPWTFSSPCHVELTHAQVADDKYYV